MELDAIERGDVRVSIPDSPASAGSTGSWKCLCCNENSSCSKEMCRFLVQAVITVLILIISVVMIAVDRGPLSVWVGTMSLATGTWLPAPRLPKRG